MCIYRDKYRFFFVVNVCGFVKNIEEKWNIIFLIL